MDEKTRQRLSTAAQDVRDHFEEIDQDVPDQSFVVGGFVRDTIMGLEPNDMDFVVIGESLDSMQDRGFTDTESSSFPVLLDSAGEEWALARTEQNTGSGHDGFEVFTDDVTLRSDLKRRDLSINSMAMNPRAGPTTATVSSEDVMVTEVFGGDQFTVFDPHGGFDDAQDGVLRHVSEAFADDPLRVLRVARYAARFAVPAGMSVLDVQDEFQQDRVPEFVDDDTLNIHRANFQVADETLDLMRELAPEMALMSRDRIGDEVTKAMRQARRPSRFWEVLQESGALAVLWPDLHRGKIVPAGHPKFHSESAYMFED